MSDLKKKYNELWKQKCSLYPDISQIHELPDVRRIIVIGDLHGDFKATIESLLIGKVINKQKKWIGGDTVVVQVGDQIDRCRQLPCSNEIEDDENSDIKILKFFTQLHIDALKDGGAVYSILGNHELMNSVGRMEYVSRMNVDDFEKQNENREFLKTKLDLKNLEAREWAFKPGNPIAEFLACTRKLALKIGNYLFVHAGIVPEIANKYNNIEDLNIILSLYLWDNLGPNLQNYQDVLGPDILKNENKHLRDNNNFSISPLWNRQFGNLSDNKESCDNLFQPLKEIYNVNNLFVGHTPQLNKGINSICQNRLWYTDIGISKAFDSAFNKMNSISSKPKIKQAQVLEINNGKVTILC